MKYLLCGINAKYIHSNLAVYCLKAFAEKEGPKTASYILKEYTINHYVDDILQDIYEEKADVVIFSCYIWNIAYVRELAEELKKVSPGTAIWVGGPEVSYEVEEFFLENPAVDLVMQGEGEETFTALVRRMEERKERDSSKERETEEGKGQDILPQSGAHGLWENIPGVAWRQAGRFFDNGTAMLMDLDRVPFVYEDFQLFEHKIIYYETSRGCPFSCSYCLSSVDKQVRFRSLEKVLPELQKFLDARVPQVKFVDRTFNCNEEHAMAIWRYIQEKDNGVTNFHFEISADLLSEKMLSFFEKMRPGLIQLEIGVQSTNPPTIDAICRHMDLPRLFENVDRVHKLGTIHQHLDLIAGLPMESYDRFKISFNELYAHKPDQLQLGFLKVLKGTCMKKNQEKYGLVYRSQPPYEVMQTGCMSYDEVIRMKGVEDMVETYYNSGQYSSVLSYVMPHFSSPFDFFEQFSLEYRRRGCHKMNHNRMDRYRILREFLKEQPFSLPLLDELLILDMYLRENIKSRPAWAADFSSYQKEIKEMYRSRGEELFPRQWQEGVYVSKKAAGRSHVEKFSFDAERFLKEGELKKKECWCLFDYDERNPLNKNARIKTFLL
ncbi:MAG: B12-binding domain-containing radical SAM protein [Eubacteriales bacterium]|nr:B12-binding domain-containing radical SAM protein [Eubacteriales bacterium]